MALQITVYTLSQGPGTLAMNNQYLTQTCHNRIVNKSIQGYLGFIHHHTANINIPMGLLGFAHEAVASAARFFAIAHRNLFLFGSLVHKFTFLGLDIDLHTAQLNLQLLALHRKHCSLLIQLGDINNISSLQLLQIHRLAIGLDGNNALTDLACCLIYSGSGLLNGSLPLLDAMIVKLLLQFFDNSLRFPTHTANQHSSLILGLADNISLFLIQLHPHSLGSGLHLLRPAQSGFNIRIHLLIKHFFLFQLINNLLKLGMVSLNQLLGPNNQGFT